MKNELSIDHVGYLEDLHEIPKYVLGNVVADHDKRCYSCCFCGVGDSGFVHTETKSMASESVAAGAKGSLVVKTASKEQTFSVFIGDDLGLKLMCGDAIFEDGELLTGDLCLEGETKSVRGKINRFEKLSENSGLHHIDLLQSGGSNNETKIIQSAPTKGCMKLTLSMMRQKTAYPIHVRPSYLDKSTGQRVAISYTQAIDRFADILLQHRGKLGRTLMYACGQIDYFSIFASQEVFRLLGVRNLTGNAEHCLNAGAVHNEMLTGQEGPFLTLDQSVKGENRLFLLNGWNGHITHPPAFRSIIKREKLDAYIIEVMVSESAVEIAKRLDAENVLLIKPASDPHLALAVAHQIFVNYPEAIKQEFISQFSDLPSFEKYKALALDPRFDASRTANRIAAEAKYVSRIETAINAIARKLSHPDTVPINIPSVGLSQTSGVVAHCLWGDLMAMLGKYGLNPDGSVAGGTLRIPGQINAESEVQGLSRKYFLGRIPMDKANEVAGRMGLPENAYQMCVEDTPRAALDYSDMVEENELFVYMGTQFEANMMERKRWLHKLEQDNVSMVVIDPFPDPYSIEHAELIIPSPPHPATAKLYQNGEWKLSMSAPHKKAHEESRSDATIIYDVMSRIGEKLKNDSQMQEAHEDLYQHVQSGYLEGRFSPSGLERFEGEVNREQLWERIQDYLHGGSGPLYCSFDHADGRPIEWQELIEQGSIIYGGVGKNRYVLDYDKPSPYSNIFREPCQFKFFTPDEKDLSFPNGIVLNTGRSPLSQDKKLIRYATSTFNAGKSTPIVDMPDENPIHLSPDLAVRLNLKTGDLAKIKNRHHDDELILPVEVNDRVKGDSLYVSFHKSRGQMERGQYINDVSSRLGRCQYSAQTSVKASEVYLEKAQSSAPDTRLLDPTSDLPVWDGENTPLYVTDIIEETHDVFTFRFQGDPLCRFEYKPGQYCTFILNIDGKRVLRSYTISSTPTRPFILEVTVKRVPGGLVSNWLPDNLEIGDRIKIAGPKGKFCLEPGSIAKKILFLGAGSGVTPMMSMSRWLSDISANVDMKFFNSVRGPNDIIFGKEIEFLTSRFRTFSPVMITSSRETEQWDGYKGRVNKDMLTTLAPDIFERTIYICGPEGFMNAAKEMIIELGFDQSNLHLESFGGARSSAGSGEASPGDIDIDFAKTGKITSTNGEMTILDFAEANEIDVDYSCRSGSCGECKMKLIKGKVRSETDEGLTEEEKEAGYFLSCVSHPTESSSFDA
jgi:ferredoxin-NADP reductase/anaerobic selenocysteine-containing dehydrogenase